MRFEIWESAADRQWYWHLKAGNGEIIASGEGYTTEEKCIHAVNLVKITDDATPVFKKSD